MDENSKAVKTVWGHISQFVSWEFCRRIKEYIENCPDQDVDLPSFFQGMVVQMTTKKQRSQTLTKHEIVARLIEDLKAARSPEDLKMIYGLLEKVKAVCPELEAAVQDLSATLKKRTRSFTRLQNLHKDFAYPVSEEVVKFSTAASRLLPAPELVTMCSNSPKGKGADDEETILSKKSVMDRLRRELVPAEIPEILKIIDKDVDFQNYMNLLNNRDSENCDTSTVANKVILKDVSVNLERLRNANTTEAISSVSIQAKDAEEFDEFVSSTSCNVLESIPLDDSISDSIHNGFSQEQSSSESLSNEEDTVRRPRGRPPKKLTKKDTTPKKVVSKSTDHMHASSAVVRTSPSPKSHKAGDKRQSVQTKVTQVSINQYLVGNQSRERESRSRANRTDLELTECSVPIVDCFESSLLGREIARMQQSRASQKGNKTAVSAKHSTVTRLAAIASTSRISDNDSVISRPHALRNRVPSSDELLSNDSGASQKRKQGKKLREVRESKEPKRTRYSMRQTERVNYKEPPMSNEDDSEYEYRGRTIRASSESSSSD